MPVGRAPKSQNGGHHLISLHPSSRTVEAESHTKGTAPFNASHMRKTLKRFTCISSTGNARRPGRLGHS